MPFPPPRSRPMPMGCAQVRDAVAVIQYLLWLEKMVPQGQVDEFLGARHIDALRRSVPPTHRCNWGVPAQGGRDPSGISPPAAFQGPAAQPRAQLRVHLRQRAQRSARPLQVWGQGLGMRSCRGLPGTMAGALTPLPSPAHPTPANGRCRWMRCTCRTPAGSTCAYPTPSPRPTVPLSWLRPALQESGPLLMSPFAGMAPQTSRGPCTGAPRPHSRRCWHRGAIPAVELGLLPEAEAGCAGGGGRGHPCSTMLSTPLPLLGSLHPRADGQH